MSLRRRESCRRAARRTTALITITMLRKVRAERPRLPSTCELPKVRRTRLADGRTRATVGAASAASRRCATGRTTHRATTTRRSTRTAGLRAWSRTGGFSPSWRRGRGIARSTQCRWITRTRRSSRRTAGSSRTSGGSCCQRQQRRCSTLRTWASSSSARTATCRAWTSTCQTRSSRGEDLWNWRCTGTTRGSRCDRSAS